VSCPPSHAMVTQPRLCNCRNVTLTGPAGQRSSLDAMPVIDVQNKIGILQLCSRCTFAFHSISIANENRAGTGGGISVFRGQPGSRVEWVSGVGLRPACGPTTSAVALVNSTQRSSLFPSPREGEQLVKSTDLVYRVSAVCGQCCLAHNVLQVDAVASCERQRVHSSLFKLASWICLTATWSCLVSILLV
jgi:hypothetical protein